MAKPGYIEVEGDKPKVEPTRKHFAAIFAGLKTAEEYARELEHERAELVERLERAERALRRSERDARWIVGQWQRLRDEPLKEVATAIVERCAEALAAHQQNDPSPTASAETR